MSDSDESGLTDMVENWIYEYIRALVWTLLKNYSANTASTDELIRGALLKAQNDNNHSDDVFLAELMHLVRNGRDLLSTSGDGITPLEEVFSCLPFLRERFGSFDRKKLAKVERFLVEQAVLVCVEKRLFSLARRVKSRLWQRDLNPAIRKLSGCLDEAIEKGSLPKGMSSFKDLINASVDLLEDLCENQLAQPYLIQLAKEEARKRNSKKTGQKRRILIKTGINLTGPLLKAFVYRHKLVAQEGVGFLPPDQFRRALDELRGRKDKLLKNLPDCLHVLATAVTPSAATSSAVTPSAATSSAVTPSAATSSAVTPSAATSSAVSPSAASPSAVSPSAASPSAVTPAATPSAANPSAVNPSAVNPAATPSAATPPGSSPRTKSIRRIIRRTFVNRGLRSRSPRSTGRHDSEPDDSTDRESKGNLRSLRKRIGVTDDSFTGVIEGVVRPEFRTNHPEVMVRRIPRTKWTKKEADSLFESVKKLGIGNWAQIVTTGVLPGRSNVDLKDKWRSMVKNEARARKLQHAFKRRWFRVDDDD